MISIPAFVINLDRRIDRMKEFTDSAFSAGITNFTRVSACEPTKEEVNWIGAWNGEPKRHLKYGNTLSHQKVFQMAKEQSIPEIMVFEDDALFLPAFKNVDMYIKELFQIPNWDVLYLGGSPDSRWPNETQSKKITSHIYSCNTVWGTHAYIVHERYYERLLEINPKFSNPFDLTLIHNFPRNYFITDELLVTQSDSFSDLTGLKFSRTEIYLENYRKMKE